MSNDLREEISAPFFREGANEPAAAVLILGILHKPALFQAASEVSQHAARTAVGYAAICVAMNLFRVPSQHRPPRQSPIQTVLHD